MRIFKAGCVFASLVSASFAAGQPDPKALLRQSIEHYDQDWRAGMHWEYTQTDVTRNDKTKEVEVSEVIPLEGTPYERVISKAGRSLNAEEQRKEDQKFERTLQQRKLESPQEREARIRKYESERSFLKDLPNAYDLKLLGEEPVDGRAAWILELTPRPDFVPTTAHGGMLKHIKGTLWIDKEEIQWAKAEAEVIDPISIGWIVARIGAGARIKLDMTRVIDGLWMPESIDINGSAKVLMVHNKRLDEHLTFSGYRPHDGAAALSRAEKAPVNGRSYR